MKKEVKIVIAVVLAVWFFVMGFEIGSYAEKKKFAGVQNETTTAQPQIVQPDTTQPTQPPVQATTPTVADPTVPQEPATDLTNLSKEEIVTKLGLYMNQLRTEQNMQAHKTSSVYVNVVECSIPSIVGMINSVIKGITDTLAPEENYSFSGGQAVDADGNNVTPKDVIPPKGKDFSLPASGVASARAEKQGSNTVYYITLAQENTNLENPVPPNHNTTLGYLDIATLNLPINVTKGDMKYPGSTITITVDANDKVISYVTKIPMEGEGSTTVLGKEGTATFEGALDENWTFTY